MGRVDEISKYYNASDKLDSIANVLFYIVAFSAITIPLLGQEHIKSYLSVFFIVIVVVYFIVRYSAMLIFLPNAEKMRRKQLISNSFAIPLTHEKTEEYYNNPYSPSVKKLGANVLENSLFSQRVLQVMLPYERVKIIVYIGLWVAALASRNICQDVILVISQSIFSAEVLARWVSMEILRNRYCEVYNDLYKVFLLKQHEGSESVPLFLDAMSNYECAKAAAGIKLSSKIFNKLNPSVTKEWEEIKVKLGIASS